MINDDDYTAIRGMSDFQGFRRFKMPECKVCAMIIANTGWRNCLKNAVFWDIKPPVRTLQEAH
jgi:hypothetical protein